jgi:ABC-type dipeptide/oligopeptide/nickel transport system permease subunit
LLGTDEIGRDFLSRIIYGTRISLFVSFMAVLLGDGVGLVWGTASGYLGGKFDIIGQRFLDLLMSFPTLILALVLLLALGAGIHTVIIAIAITRIPTSTRVIRSVTLSIKENMYVDAAKAIGASDLRVMTLHIAPQCMAPFLILATAHLGTVIITEASLGFLGLGIPPPTPSWGNMLGGAVAGVFKPSWWLVIFPGVAITITVLAFNMFGDTIRDVLDPRLRGR